MQYQLAHAVLIGSAGQVVLSPFAAARVKRQVSQEEVFSFILFLCQKSRLNVSVFSVFSRGFELNTFLQQGEETRLLTWGLGMITRCRSFGDAEVLTFGNGLQVGNNRNRSIYTISKFNIHMIGTSWPVKMDHC